MQALNKIEIDEYKLGQTNSLPHTDSLSDKKNCQLYHIQSTSNTPLKYYSERSFST
jgi:hypothetical protein